MPLIVAGTPTVGDARPEAGRPEAGRPEAARPEAGRPEHRLVVRALMPDDIPAVRRLFRETLCLGRPLPFEVPEWDAYQSLCLDWYLGPGRDDAAVLVEGVNIAGYALVCTNAAGHQRWQRHQAALFSTRACRRLLATRLDPDASRFLRLRLKDGWSLWRHAVVPPLPAHAHINLVGSARASRSGRLLAEHVDRRCQAAGLPGWFGEINAVRGHRARALERLGATIVHRAPNHTLSWLMGQPVERLTVARWLPAAAPPATSDGAADGAADGATNGAGAIEAGAIDHAAVVA